jgi:YD repeat-containing protein
VVSSTYTRGWLTSQTVPGATLTYDYDAWGGVSEVVSDVGATARTVRTTPLWVDAVELETGAITRGRTYGWHANGHLETKGAPGKFEEGYVYDTLGQLVAVTNAPTGLAEESYTYSAGGDVTSMTGRDGVEWSSTVGALHQTTSRTSVEGTETYAYDATGRLSSMVRGGSVTFYRYDGLGRLRAVENGVGLVRAFDRDADGVIVRRWGGSAPASYEVAGWSEEVGRPAKEDYTPHVSGAAGQLQFHLVEFDGTNIVSSRPLGAVVGFRRQGAYGQEFTSGGEPELRRSFHGHREEPGLALTAAGPRHLLRADGRWLQPEPLLYLGIPEELRSDPRALMMYRYGHNAPSVYADPSGMSPSPVDQAPAHSLDTLVKAMNKELPDQTHFDGMLWPRRVTSGVVGGRRRVVGVVGVR